MRSRSSPGCGRAAGGLLEPLAGVLSRLGEPEPAGPIASAPGAPGQLRYQFSAKGGGAPPGAGRGRSLLAASSWRLAHRRAAPRSPCGGARDGDRAQRRGHLGTRPGAGREGEVLGWRGGPRPRPRPHLHPHGAGARGEGRGARGAQLSYSLVGCRGAEDSCEISPARAQRSPEGLRLSGTTNPIR